MRGKCTLCNGNGMVGPEGSPTEKLCARCHGTGESSDTWSDGVDDCIDILWTIRECARVSDHPDRPPDLPTLNVVDHCLKLLRGLKERRQ